MLVFRPVVGVRNPVRSTSSPSSLRAKIAGSRLSEAGRKPYLEHPHRTVSLVEAAGGGAISAE